MSHNKWEARLWALAEENIARGDHAVANVLRRWANGQEEKKVVDDGSFVDAMLMSGYGMRDAIAGLGAVRDMTQPPSFFMVYREGGRQPTFKHMDMASASEEAQRIRRVSGDTTYVLGVYETYRAHARPTPEQIIEHARKHSYGTNGGGWGLWRIRRDGEMPHIVAVRGAERTPPYIAHDCDWHPGDHIDNIADEFEWFPLDANGKDVTVQDIPF